MGASGSKFDQCLVTAVGGAGNVAFPSNPVYQLSDVKRYNLEYDITPAAVTYPSSSQQVANVIKCAVDAGAKVQARGGGHSYGDYCIGGQSGAVVVDMKKLNQFSMDRTTWQATIGSGFLLDDVTKKLHENGGRAMAHGTCPQVGIGGHATIGGLGPPSRMWGSALDHVQEVEVVLANSSIVRASENQNSDVFFALKGAGASFGVITEFKVRTQPEPGQAVQYSFSFTKPDPKLMALVFKKWQQLVSSPTLTRKFASQVTVLPLIGMVISGTFFGPKSEFDDLKLGDIFPSGFNLNTTTFNDWLGMTAHWAEGLGLEVAGGIPSNFYSKSLAFTNETLISDAGIDNVFQYIDKTDKGTPIWMIIFDLAGGAVNDVAPDATAYAHRDALFYIQTYAVNLVGKVPQATRDFLNGLNDVILGSMPKGTQLGSYAGYVDPALPNGPELYWRQNLPRLQNIKKAIDPNDVFHNPQSVRPSA